MRQVLYFEPFNGASGDMIVGALLHLGMPLDFLRGELDKLGLSDEFSVRSGLIERQGLQMQDFGVDSTTEPAADQGDSPQAGEHSAEKTPSHPHAHHHHAHSHDHPHDHSHEHPHDHTHDHHHGQEGHAHGGRLERGLKEITHLIESSSLDAGVRENALRIFNRLGRAEAKVHGTSIDEVHFHEVGAIDSIVDIVGACVGFEYLGIDEFYSAPLAVGGGTVRFSHGDWPAPTPATLELLEGVPCSPGPVQSELLTPTGAAIITTLAQGYVCPPFTLKKWGFGAGDKDFRAIPNALRISLGEISDTPLEGAQRETIVVLECCVDDVDGELLGNLMELSLSNGALDVYYSTLHMKKSRPGMLLAVLCHPPQEAGLAQLIFRETGTLGLRRRETERYVLDRELLKVETQYGSVRVKIGKLAGETVQEWPEFEDLKALSHKHGVALKTLRTEVIRELKNHG